MKIKSLVITIILLTSTIWSQAQQINPVPDYVFRNQMSVGRNAVTDTGAYFSIGPRYGANKGFMPPIVGDTATFSSGKRNGLLIFSVQKNKFLYWDSVRVQWSDMAGSSGSYITGKGITGYVPQFSDTATLDTSALYTLGNQLGVGTSSFAYTGSGRTVVELNGTAGGILGFKRNDSAKGYLFHNGDNMELANTMAGSISFNTNSATRGSIASDGVWRLHNLAGTGDRVVQASSNGTLSATASVTGLVDTLTISTRAWRQKGIDSVVSIIPAAGVGGSGTTNYVAKFTAGSTIGNSQIFDNGTGVGIGTTSPILPLQIAAGNKSAFNISYDASGNARTGLFMWTGGSSVGVIGGGVEQTSDGVFTARSTSASYMQFFGGDTRFFNNASLTSGNTYTPTERLRIFANGRVFIGASPTDAGYQLDINGTLRSVNGANFATTSGLVGIGTASPSAKFDVDGVARIIGSGSAPSTGEGIEFQYAANQGEVLTYNRTGAAYTPLRVRSSTIKLYGGGGAGGIDIATSGNVGIGTASPAAKTDISGTLRIGAASFVAPTSGAGMEFSYRTSDSTGYLTTYSRDYSGYRNQAFYALSQKFAYGTGGAIGLFLTSSGETLINTESDAGDYKLQVVGNARIGTGKLDIASNTTFGLGVARSGTSEVAGQIYNSNGILYLGAESSAGGQIFSGSSAYAAVIGSGANYPLQFATNNVTRATINTAGELLIATTTDNGDFKLQVNGNALISGSIKTANGGSSTAVPWHLGSVVATSVQLDTNNYVEVEINGVYYRLAIVTPL